MTTPLPQAGDIARFVDELARWDRIAGSLVHRARLGPSPPRYADPAEPLTAPLRSVLDRLGVARLYTHQAAALDLVRAGRDVAVVTPTASGKSLVFILPTIESTLAEPGARSLYLFPYKALEQDQSQNLKLLGRKLFSGVDLSSAIYDGDTPQATRRKIKASPPDVLISNPDMLHLGILAYHADWREFFAKLRYVVVDELHVYRGIFGSHLAHVLRRLWRVCAHYGSTPRLIACSATVGNPAEFASKLTGRDVSIVEDNGAPRAGKHFLFVNPQASPYTLATEILARSVAEGYKTIAFTKARRITELIHSWLVRARPELRGRVASYRAGYLPEERREIERRLFSGELAGVVSTSALELGIDVGGLDVCLLVGYPGSIMSSWQRIGRVGRSDRESLTVLIALPDALDQYFMRRPGEFFGRPFERAVVDPGNATIASAHLVCAGAEIPLVAGDAALYPGAEPVLEELVAGGRLVRDASGSALFSLKRRPHRDVSLRSAGESWAILDTGQSRTIGSVDGVRVHHECHEGAIYLHAGTQYRVNRLDGDKRRVECEACEVDYYTQAIGDKETEILETFSLQGRGPMSVGLGRLKVTVRINGYERRRIFGQDLLSRHPLECPPIVFETVGFWIVVPEALEAVVTRAEGHFMGGLHAAEHAMISLFPLLALCDRGDIGGISYNRNPQLGAPAIFIYDGYPGGIGLAEGVHADLGELLDRTSTLLEECECDDGCPSCIQSPRCGSGNRPLDKTAAQTILAVLSGRSPLPMAATGETEGEDAMEPAAGDDASADEQGEGEHPRPSRGRATKPAGTPGRVRPGIHRGQPPVEERVFVHEEGPAVPGGPGDAAPDRKQDTAPERTRARAGDGRIVFFDLETQRSAEEVGGWGRISAMGLALAVVYEPAVEQYRTYLEKDVERLLIDLLTADTVVGFNVDRFDIEVLRPYAPHDLSRIRTVDMLTHIHSKLGFRLSLGHLAELNLGEGKSGDGLQSLRWLREGRIDLVESYCRKDVEITARLFYLGRERGYLIYRDNQRRLMQVPVTW